MVPERLRTAWSRLPAPYEELWPRLVALGAPVSAHGVARNLMRTTDALIAASLSPAAVAGLAVADLYRQLNGRVGGGIGGGAVALASQDTGAGADANRDEALSQAALLCVLVAIPFAVAGVAAGPTLIRLVGAEGEAVDHGAAYLAVTLGVAPLTLPKAVFAQAFSAVGDTKTPTGIGVVADALNVVGSLALGLGFAPLGIPRLGVFGLGVATATVSVFATAPYVVLLAARSPYRFVVPSNPTVGKQLLRVGVPQATEGFATTFAVFPFSRILLGLPSGTAVYAGYQVAWRLYGQLVGVINAGASVATKIVVGQRLGDDDVAGARAAVRAGVALVALLAGTAGAVMIVAAEPLAALVIAGDAGSSAVQFARLLGAVALVGGANNVVGAALQGASETRIPLVSRLVGMFGGMVGLTWLLAVGLNWGTAGAYAGVAATYVLFLAVSTVGYLRTDWAGRAAEMMAERGTAEAEPSED
ncbi:MAG: MATE family efflux transporter [Halolamina sp.]